MKTNIPTSSSMVDDLETAGAVLERQLRRPRFGSCPAQALSTYFHACRPSSLRCHHPCKSSPLCVATPHTAIDLGMAIMGGGLEVRRRTAQPAPGMDELAVTPARPGRRRGRPATCRVHCWRRLVVVVRSSVGVYCVYFCRRIADRRHQLELHGSNGPCQGQAVQP
jgi:hypothetical protein